MTFKRVPNTTIDDDIAVEVAAAVRYCQQLIAIDAVSPSGIEIIKYATRDLLLVIEDKAAAGQSELELLH